MAAVNPRGPRSPRGHATGAPGGYKCPRRGTEASFFFLAFTFTSLSRFARALFARRHFFSGDLLANPGDLSRPELSAVRQPPARQAGATGPRGSTLRSSPPRSPPVRSGSSSPFDLSWSSSTSSSIGSWRLSCTDDDIAAGAPPPDSSGGGHAAPGEEVEPKPEPGERVVFGAHLDRGLGLPASAFFRRFLDFFGLQPHHLPANACVLLSCYVAFMEGYAGLWPDVDFWSRLFYLKSQMTEGRLRTCGCASIYPRAGSLFPKIPTVDSVKNWQMSFFYVKNANPAFDRINLPEYNPAPPTTRLNWGHNAKSADPDAEVNLLWDFLGECVQGGRLSAEDLLCTYMERRVIPLQGRVHKIGLMSGRLDPTRTSRIALTKAQVAHRVNNITKANMPEDWAWGLPPYDRAAPPERIFPRQEIEDGDLAHKIWTADLVDPADQAGDQAGDDDLPAVPDQGGQGEHNPPPSPEQREEEEAEPATSTTGPGPIRAVPLRTRPPAASATSAPKKKKRAAGGSTARLEGQAKRQRQQGPKKVPEMAGAAIKFNQGGASGPAARVAPPFRQREPTPATCTHAARCRRATCGYAASCGGIFFGCASFSAGPGRPGRMVDERRTVLYNKVVTSYHKAKIERGTLARELEAVKVEAAKVPQLERDLRVARAQCAESEEAGRAAAAKLKVADGETAEKEKVDDLSRRLDEVEAAAALQKEVTAKSTELTATAKHWTDLIGAIDRGFSAAFPETQDAALAAVGDAREARGRATGEGSSESFTMEDHMSSLAARVEPITKFGWELRKAAEELAPESFIEWKGSATRAGADMALSFVLSWYNEVDLGQLEYRRAGVEEELSADQKAARLARASAIADFVDKRLFIADPNPHSDEEEELEDEGVEMDSPPPAVDPTGPAPAGA
ncbi:hypothetical protein QYE76_048855 [Lolium multiflorum]|uniref:Transposase (putative) gypsy type domain-containing protein n=1 Tax=Lolium multiflorum TaxID=4521 RepID=A0AAD8SNW3_LOLMU|nr:hypothetical protein QYE76_048855 [Lolium multiflorum]